MEVGLGSINPHAIEIGSFVIHWYGVIIAAAIVLAIHLSTREAKKKVLKRISSLIWLYGLFRLVL